MSASHSSGSTRTSRPPWPLAAIAMFPPIKKASPPNIFCSVRSGSAAIRSRMRPASFSSYATTEFCGPWTRGCEQAILRRMASDDDSGLGFSFWAKFAGVVVLLGIAAFVLLLILTRAVYAWGFFGAMIVFVAVLL